MTGEITFMAIQKLISHKSFSISASILYSMTSLLLPTFAVVTLNQEWSLDIDFLGITYKPWRLFLVVCGLPSLLCALVLFFVIPESPKYAFSSGDEPMTLRILEKIYCMNTGNSAQKFEVKSIIKNEEFGENTRGQSQGFFNYMWTQSVPLFKGQHLKNILTACFIQFAVCNAGNGFWTFFPEIFNKVSLWQDASLGSATICEIFSGLEMNQNSTEIA